MPIPKEPTTCVELTKHTLLVAQCKDERVHSFRECSLADKGAVEETLNAIRPDWRILGLPALTALSPQPTYWHRATAAEASLHRTENALRDFGAALPHGFNDSLELTACHAADGTLISPDGHARWLLGITSETSLALSQANAVESRIMSTRAESATLCHIGAIAHELRVADRGSVVLWDLTADRSHLFLITPRGVQSVAPCAVGMEDIFTAAQNALGLSARSVAAKIFFDPNYGFLENGPKIAAQVALAFKAAYANLAGSDTSPQLACTGLTSKQAWFVRDMAAANGLVPWSPKISSFCAHLELRFASPEIAASLTPASFGLLHLVASQQVANAVWHPVWSRIGFTRLTTAAPFFAPPLPAAAAPVPTGATTPPDFASGPRAPRVKPSLRSTSTPPPAASIKVAAPKPALAPKMAKLTVARLWNEAYVYLCRQSLTTALNELENEKKRITGTRPPFGMFGTRKAVEAYESSVRSTQDTEITYRQQLKELDPIDHWLQSILQDLLHDYLENADPEYHGFSEICLLVERWQNLVGGLHEFSMGFAREARVMANLIGSKVGADDPRFREAVANLAAVAANLHSQTVKIELVTKDIMNLAAAGKLTVTMPELPKFQNIVWVDRVMAKRPSDALKDLKREEEVARAFFAAGKNDLLMRAESTRSISLHARLEYLNKYWDNLRPRVRQQCETTLDVGKTLAELKRSYAEADLQRQQEAQTNNPFALVR